MKTIKKNKKLNSMLAFVIAVIAIPSIAIATLVWHNTYHQQSFSIKPSTPDNLIEWKEINMQSGNLAPNTVLLRDGDVYEIVQTVSVKNLSSQKAYLDINQSAIVESITAERQNINPPKLAAITKLLKDALKIQHYYQKGEEEQEFTQEQKPEIQAKETMTIKHKITLQTDVLQKEEHKDTFAWYRDLTPSQINITIPYELVQQSK